MWEKPPIYAVIKQGNTRAKSLHETPELADAALNELGNDYEIQVRKGDRLVSAGNGLARAARTGEATAFNVIGRALQDKIEHGEGTVEAIVTIK
jgi:hypothetical protein